MSSNNGKIEILFFYSISMYENVRTKLILNDYLNSNVIAKEIVLKEIDFDKEIDLCKKYNVTGVPTTIVYHNEKQFYRHLGELSDNELEFLFAKIKLVNEKKL